MPHTDETLPEAFPIKLVTNWRGNLRQPESPSAVTSTSARVCYRPLPQEPHDLTKSVLLIFRVGRTASGATMTTGEPAMEIPKRLWIGMVVLGACARLAPHPWNFTPMMAIGLFAGSQARKASTGVLATLLALALSDAVLGFYPGIWYVYAAALIPVLFGRFLRNRSGAGAIAPAALASSLSFFIITNFMVWATDRLYPHTLGGLAECYLAGIPFYRNQVLGDALYTIAIFGGYAVLNRLYQPARQAA